MMTLTLLRPAEDVGYDDLDDIVDEDVGHDNHDGADKARFQMLSTTIKRMSMLLRHKKMLGMTITMTLTHFEILFGSIRGID